MNLDLVVRIHQQLPVGNRQQATNCTVYIHWGSLSKKHSSQACHLGLKNINSNDFLRVRLQFKFDWRVFWVSRKKTQQDILINIDQFFFKNMRNWPPFFTWTCTSRSNLNNLLFSVLVLSSNSFTVVCVIHMALHADDTSLPFTPDHTDYSHSLWLHGHITTCASLLCFSFSFKLVFLSFVSFLFSGYMLHTHNYLKVIFPCMHCLISFSLS